MKANRIAAALVVLGFSAVACGASSGSGSRTPGKDMGSCAPNASPRLKHQGRPLFQSKVQSLCSDCEVIYRNAGGDATLQEQQAQSAIAAGANVIVLDPVNTTFASAIATAAAKRHVAVIAYDRLVLNAAGVTYYVAFDNETIGALQGDALLTAMNASTKPTVVMIHGDPADLNAEALKKAAHGALDGKVTIAKEYDTPASSPGDAQLEMTQALTALNNKLDGVYAADDGVAGGLRQGVHGGRPVVSSFPSPLAGEGQGGGGRRPSSFAISSMMASSESSTSRAGMRITRKPWDSR